MGSQLQDRTSHHHRGQKHEEKVPVFLIAGSQLVSSLHLDDVHYLKRPSLNTRLLVTASVLQGLPQR